MAEMTSAAKLRRAADDARKMGGCAGDDAPTRLAIAGEISRDCDAVAAELEAEDAARTLGAESHQAIYGIWLFDVNSKKPDEAAGSWWCGDDVSQAARLAFTEELTAQKVAADNFGYDDYAKCREDGWCEVRKFPEVKSTTDIDARPDMPQWRNGADHPRDSLHEIPPAVADVAAQLNGRKPDREFTPGGAVPSLEWKQRSEGIWEAENTRGILFEPEHRIAKYAIYPKENGKGFEAYADGGLHDIKGFGESLVLVSGPTMQSVKDQCQGHNDGINSPVKFSGRFGTVTVAVVSPMDRLKHIAAQVKEVWPSDEAFRVPSVQKLQGRPL